MTTPDAPDRDSEAASAGGVHKRAEPTADPGESQRADQSRMRFLNRIGVPGLADIELDGSLPASPPRDVDLD